MYKGLRPSGIIPAVITSFTATGELDLDGVRTNVEHLVEQGVWGLLMCGSTGEAATLEPHERVTIVEAAVEAAAGRVKIIAGTGAPSTAEVIRLSQDAMKAGADALLVLTPFYNIPTQEGLLRHYTAIDDATELPIIMYNIPEHTRVDIELDTLEKLAELEHVVGLKESSGRTGYIAAAQQRVGEKISILDGGDDTVFPSLCMGLPGNIVALGNLAPKELVSIHNAVRSGEHDVARDIYYRIMPIARAIAVSVNFPSTVKAGVELLGRPAGPPRSPILPTTAQEKEEVRRALVASKLL